MEGWVVGVKICVVYSDRYTPFKKRIPQHPHLHANPNPIQSNPRLSTTPARRPSRPDAPSGPATTTHPGRDIPTTRPGPDVPALSQPLTSARSDWRRERVVCSTAVGS